MRVLCGVNVATKYVDALCAADEISVATVEVVLSKNALDAEIAEHATRNGWVLLTTDDDFYHIDHEFGLLFYRQLADPSPGVVVNAVERIDQVYDSESAVETHVPDGWV